MLVSLVLEGAYVVFPLSVWMFDNNATASVAQLYAFFYVPNPPFAVNNGWSIYTLREEFSRMGVGTRSKAWRFTDINKDYSVRQSCACAISHS